MAYSKPVLAESDEIYSRSVLDGSEEYFSRTHLGDSNEVNEIHCEPCMKKGNTVDAVKHCLDCAEYLCVQCFKSHAKFKAFQNHLTNDVNTVNPVTKTSSKIATSTVRDTLSELQIDPKTDQQLSRRLNAKNSSTKTNKKLTAKIVSIMKVRSRSDKQIMPYIEDLTIVHSHYCVVTDNANKSIKAIDTRQMRVVYKKRLGIVDLCAITSVNNKQVTVSVEIKEYVYKLMFFSVSKSGIISHTGRSLDMRTIYEAIIHHKDRFYASHYRGIHIVTMYGQIVQTIDNDAFDFLEGIALSNDHNTIDVCSYHNDTVFSVDLEGNIKATYKDQDLKRPDGVTVDCDGYVYVCSYGTKCTCIHQLTADLNKVQVIISDVLVGRCTFNRADNRLYVSFCDEIKVYDMNYNQFQMYGDQSKDRTSLQC